MSTSPDSHDVYFSGMDLPADLAKYLRDKLAEVGLDPDRAAKLSAEIIKAVNLEVLRLAHDSLPPDKRPDFASQINSAKDEAQIRDIIASYPGLDQDHISKTAVDNTYLKIERLLSTTLSPTQ